MGLFTFSNHRALSSNKPIIVAHLLLPRRFYTLISLHVSFNHSIIHQWILTSNSLIAINLIIFPRGAIITRITFFLIPARKGVLSFFFTSPAIHFRSTFHCNPSYPLSFISIYLTMRVTVLYLFVSLATAMPPKYESRAYAEPGGALPLAIKSYGGDAQTEKQRAPLLSGKGIKREHSSTVQIQEVPISQEKIQEERFRKGRGT